MKFLHKILYRLWFTDVKTQLYLFHFLHVFAEKCMKIEKILSEISQMSISDILSHNRMLQPASIFLNIQVELESGVLMNRYQTIKYLNTVITHVPHHNWMTAVHNNPYVLWICEKSSKSKYKEMMIRGNISDPDFIAHTVYMCWKSHSVPH